MNALASGVRLSSYQLVDLIGRTKMSEVWRAQDRDGTIVALKTISSLAGEDPRLRARFLREGGEHQLLKHPAIVPILDFFEQNDDFYLVMQYISGGSLEDRLEKQGWNPLPIPEALKIARQILPALDYAHQRLIVHRDVKPSNILLEGDRAFLGDFGIALALGRPRLTTYNQVMGTRCYMSPEQIQTPLEVTHLSDVYSFGCVLYEMLTGRQPFPTSDNSEEAQYATLARRVHETPIPPRQFNSQISPRLERIVLTSLAPNPQDRFPGCGSFARAMEGVELQRPDAVLPHDDLLKKPEPLINPPQPSAPARRISVTGHVLAGVFASLLWVPFLGQAKELLGLMFILSVVLAAGVFLKVLYQAWSAFPGNTARTAADKAVGYLFIPVFDLYWLWRVLPGLAVDFNYYMRDRPLEEPQPVNFYRAFCVLLYLMLSLAALQLFDAAAWLCFFNLIIMLPITIGMLAGAHNRIVAAAQLATAAIGTETGTR